MAFIGFAIGILRFRLFEVEYWWFKSWLWLLGGCVVVIMDMLLVGLLNTPQLYALGLSVLLTGFFYFPLRQWLMGKWMPLESRSVQDFLPRFSAALAEADSPEAFEQQWQVLLRLRFAPQHLTQQAIATEQPQLADNGLHLKVPALADGMTYQMSGKQMASRLFNKADLKAASVMLGIARLVRDASEAREQAIHKEREQLLLELNTTIGKKLRDLAESLPTALQKKAAEDVLITLDATVKLSLQTEPFSLHTHLQAWQAEISQRTAAAGTRLDWQADNVLEQRELSPKQGLELSQLLREAVSNALKHAHPAFIRVRFSLIDEQLHMSISNDGTIQPINNWHAGTGLSSMAARIKAYAPT